MRAVPGSTQASADDNEESCLDPKEVRVRFWQVYSMNPNRVMSLHRLPPSCRGGILPLSMLGLWERMGSVTFSAPQHHLAGKARWSDGESPEAGETDRDSRGGVEQLEEKGHYWVTQLQSWELYFQLMYMFIHPSIHPSSTYLSITHLPIHSSIHPSSIHLSIPPSSTPPSTYPSLHHPFTYPSITHPPIHSSVHPPSIHLSIHYPSTHPSIIHPLTPLIHPTNAHWSTATALPFFLNYYLTFKILKICIGV